MRRRIVISWHRFYDPATGRYISADPVGLDGGINLFAYVGQDPINGIDPEGLTEWDAGSDPPVIPNHFPWNGNFTPDYTPQDGVCSDPAGRLNNNECTRGCCEEHDRCYARNRCNQTSWVGTFTPSWAPACQRCNREAVKCVLRNVCREAGDCI